MKNEHLLHILHIYTHLELWYYLRITSAQWYLLAVDLCNIGVSDVVIRRARIFSCIWSVLMRGWRLVVSNMQNHCHTGEIRWPKMCSSMDWTTQTGILIMKGNKFVWSEKSFQILFCTCNRRYRSIDHTANGTKSNLQSPSFRDNILLP